MALANDANTSYIQELVQCNFAFIALGLEEVCNFIFEVEASTSSFKLCSVKKMHLFTRCLFHSWLFRQQRLAEMKAAQMKNKFGEVLEISGKDYVQEVTKAGKGIWVVLHLYKQG